MGKTKKKNKWIAKVAADKVVVNGSNLEATIASTLLLIEAERLARKRGTSVLDLIMYVAREELDYEA